MKYVLETPRLRLREVVAADIDFFAEMLGDALVMRYYPRVLDRSGAQAWIDRTIDRYAKYGHGLWLLEERASGAPVGNVGLVMQQVEQNLEPEIGYMIHRSFWRRGLATEAALEVRRYAFDDRKFPYVVSLIRPENRPSQGVARKLGMSPVRTVDFADRPHLLYRVDRP